MRKSILIVPEWADATGDSTVLSELHSLMSVNFETEIGRLGPLDKFQCQELSFLGIDPTEFRIEQGPVASAAMQVDPPDRSAEFQVTMVTYLESGVQLIKDSDEFERRSIWAHAKRLETHKMKLFDEAEIDGVMVIEDGSPESHTSSPNQLAGKRIADFLPEGDDDRLLRRFIDDSVNLLQDHEVNHHRLDRGLNPINLLWPWGGGTRPRLPNISTSRGPAMVESNSVRLQGLARLVGWSHGNRSSFGHGTNVRLESMVESARKSAIGISVIDSIQQFRSHGQFEECAWLTHEMGSRYLDPILNDVRDRTASLLVLAPSSSNIGLFAMMPSNQCTNHAPFDERTIHDQKVNVREVWNVVDTYLRWNPNL